MMCGPLFLLDSALSALVVCAAVFDLRARIIPNWLTLCIALGAPLFWLASGFSLWPDIALQLLLALGCFTLFALAFAAKMMGGGDVKMIVALALWLPGLLLGRMLVLMALIGGALGLIYWITWPANGLMPSARPFRIHWI